MSLTATANVYSGVLDIGKIPSGPSTFTVTAADIIGLKGSATGCYVHDHGPTVTILQPTMMTAKGTINVEIEVDDPLHPITDISQVQAGIRGPSDIALTQETGASPFRVAAVVDLTKYNPPLDGPQLINATATNSKGTVGKASKQFIVDNTGPTIDNLVPGPGAFVGGVQEISASAPSSKTSRASTTLPSSPSSAATWPRRSS
jgi:hypothetical protein